MNVRLRILGKNVRYFTHEHEVRRLTDLYVDHATQIKYYRNVDFSACDYGSNQFEKHGMSERNILYVSLIPRIQIYARKMAWAASAGKYVRTNTDQVPQQSICNNPHSDLNSTKPNPSSANL
jgi:hypothetical protein